MTTPQKFRKKPVVVEAIQWTGENTQACIDFVDAGLRVVDGVKVDSNGDTAADGLSVELDGTTDLWVDANDAWVKIQPGSWIIRDKSGCYPCLPERFAETYETVS